jgi:hypothetical protein
MAKANKAESSRTGIRSNKSKRPGRHAKSASVTNKNSKKYKKLYRGQGK